MTVFSFVLLSSGAQLSLKKGQETFHYKESLDPRSFAEQLPLVIDTFFKQHNVESVHKIVTLKGPGSFTTIRLALATALGLSTGFQASVLSINSFQALFHCFDQDLKKDGNRFLTLIDTKKDTFYGQYYNDKGQEQGDPTVVEKDDIKKVLDWGDLYIINDLMDADFSNHIESQKNLENLSGVLLNWAEGAAPQNQTEALTPYYFMTPDYKKTNQTEGSV